jgi:branched-chain amino acid transport system substrate-binding protein
MTRRSLTAAIATCTAVALLAGCGGSATGTSAVQAGAALGAVNTAAPAAPVVAAGTTVAGTAGHRTGNAAGGAGTSTATTAAAPSKRGTKTGAGIGTSSDKTNGGKSSGVPSIGQATAGPAAAVERLVSSHPIFGGSAACGPANLSEIPIGNVSTLSGVLGEALSPAREALQIFVAAQNACGGLNGHRIKLYVDDDQGDPATATAKVQSMIEIKKVLAFVGNTQVLTIDAVVPVIKKYGIPIIGGDIASNTWFTNPLLFPQGPPPAAVAYGYLKGATEYFKKTNVGDLWCIEVPRACEENDRAFRELAPGFGITVKRSIASSITAPSYVQQCLDLQSSGVEALALLVDAASMVRVARSCEQVGYHPKILPTPLGIGNQKQFLTGNEWLGNSYVALNYFPWFANETPVEKYWQSAMKKYDPGADIGAASSAGWTAGALLVAASALLSPTNPTTAELLAGLYAFGGQKWTGLGGLSGPRTFLAGKAPRVPYCLFAAISNATNTGWASAVSTPQCTEKLAPSDPQNGQ